MMINLRRNKILSVIGVSIVIFIIGWWFIKNGGCAFAAEPTPQQKYEWLQNHPGTMKAIRTGTTIAEMTIPQTPSSHMPGTEVVTPTTTPVTPANVATGAPVTNVQDANATTSATPVKNKTDQEWSTEQIIIFTTWVAGTVAYVLFKLFG